MKTAHKGTYAWLSKCSSRGDEEYQKQERTLRRRLEGLFLAPGHIFYSIYEWERKRGALPLKALWSATKTALLYLKEFLKKIR